MMAKHKNVRRAWGLSDPNGDLWFETFAFKKRAIAFATQRCIGAHEYERLADDSARWQLAYKRGFRIVPVDIRRAS